MYKVKVIFKNDKKIRWVKSKDCQMSFKEDEAFKTTLATAEYIRTELRYKYRARTGDVRIFIIKEGKGSHGTHKAE